MLNARVIKVTAKNADSGKVTLQPSDLTDFIEGKLKVLIIHDEGTDVCEGKIYQGEDLNELMASAVRNGPIWHKTYQENFFLAIR